MRKFKLIIKQRRVYFPTIRIPMIGVGVSLPLDMSFKLPSITGFNIGGSVGKIVVLGCLTSAVAIGIAIMFSVKDLTAAPVYPSPAVYDAGESQRMSMKSLGEGEAHKESSEAVATQTLKLNIGGARIESIVFKDMEIGAAGLSDAIEIAASSDVIQCETMEFIDVKAPDLTMSTSTAYNLNMTTTTTDGSSVSPTLSGDPVNYIFGANRGALNIPDVSSGTVDRIVISSNATSTVGLIRFERVNLTGDAGINISGVNCGTVTFKGTDTDKFIVGDGTGIDSASFTIADTVKVGNIPTVSSNVEKPVSVMK